MTPKRKRGRPPKPAHEKKSHTLKISVTPKDRDALKIEAKRQGVTLSQLFRNWIHKKQEAEAKATEGT